MKDIWQGFEIFNTAPLAICVALIACIAKQAYTGWQGLPNFIRKLVLSAFVGMVLSWALADTGYSDELKGAIIGGGVFASDSIIEPILKKIVNLINNWHGSLRGNGQ